ncbi:hypothetical protein PR048_028247 [Dryococelus australis]|uniref:Cilium assembly protein DZIP1 domain-containing protein n=1 Tax=Dryococelus australis TaxID=614101 RepID=A0ABQ9GIP5_9NEOP|nr:hypothetical protein PR048_028247 [Dryococelus australis]
MFTAPVCCSREVLPWVSEFLNRPEQLPKIPFVYLRFDVALPPTTRSNINSQHTQIPAVHTCTIVKPPAHASTEETHRQASGSNMVQSAVTSAAPEQCSAAHGLVWVNLATIPVPPYQLGYCIQLAKEGINGRLACQSRKELIISDDDQELDVLHAAENLLANIIHLCYGRVVLGEKRAKDTKMISTYESKIQSLTAHMKEQDLTLHSQGEQIIKLTSQPHMNHASRQITQSGVSRAPLIQSTVQPTGESDDGNLTLVKPFTSDQPLESSESSSPLPVLAPSTTVVMPMKVKSLSVKQKSLHPESIHSSRDSGLDSPRRAPLQHAEKVANLKTEHQKAEDQEELEGSEESDESVSDEETSEMSESASQQDEESIVVGVPSLQEAIALNPNILTELKGDLQDILERRLRELGIDPEWEGIPKATFMQKMSTVKHQQNITAKVSTSLKCNSCCQ